MSLEFKRKGQLLSSSSRRWLCDPIEERVPKDNKCHEFIFIRPDVAIVHVTNQISGFLATDGATEAPHNESSIRVFQKDNGIWRVSAFHNTSVAASFKRN